MQEKFALITLCNEEICPRFDMTTEVLLVPTTSSCLTPHHERKHLVLAHASSEELCDVITKAGVSVVLCGGIEEDYYHYLRWKRIDVICDVAGPVEKALERLMQGSLRSSDNLFASGDSQ